MKNLDVLEIIILGCLIAIACFSLGFTVTYGVISLIDQ